MARFIRLLLGIVLLTTYQTTQAAPPSQADFAANLEVFSDGVEMMRAGTEQWLPVSGRSVVAAGDRIRTDATGEAIIIWFDDGTLLELRPETEVVINEFSGDGEQSTTIDAQVVAGRVFNSVNRVVDSDSRYTISTPTLQAAVRGTQFALDVSEDLQTSLVVGEGVVAASVGDTQHQVEGGFWMQTTAPNLLAEDTPADDSDSTAAEARQVVDVSGPFTFAEGRDNPIIMSMVSGLQQVCEGIARPPGATALRIYQTPTQESEVLGSVPAISQLTVLAVLGTEWFEVVWEADIAWVQARLLRVAADCQAALPTATAENPVPRPDRIMER